MSLAGVAIPAVRILLEQRVAGYDAVVLEADDPLALSAWLRERGYDSRPALVDWLAPYVEARWKITAFKLAVPGSGASGPGDGARYAVRMSFATDRPLFPFRTPADQSAQGPGNNLLRIFFIGRSRVQGRLGDEPWRPRIPYSRPHDDVETLLGDAVPEGTAPAKGWVTTFEDAAWPRRAGGDLYFTDDHGPEIVPPPVTIPREVVVPIELLVIVAGIGLWLWSRRQIG
jgi:hypothetical protein